MHKPTYLALVLVFLLPLQTFGHAKLVFPPPRSPSDGIKTGPCGGIAKTSNPMNFQIGTTVSFQWSETIDHPGYYEIYLATTSNDNDLLLASNLIKPNIPDIQGGALPHNYSTTFVVPNTPCTNCSVLLIQYMTETNPASKYYSCADISISASKSSPAPPPPPPPPPGTTNSGSSPKMTSSKACGMTAGIYNNQTQQASAMGFWFLLAPALIRLSLRRKK